MHVVFHRVSGITHMLAEPAPAILETLSHEPLSLNGIVTKLTRDYDLQNESGTDSLTDSIAARIDELIAVGIVHVAEHNAI